MDTRLRLVLALHQHQPVGNLDTVIESAYADAYQPLLAALSHAPAPPVNLHTSGSLVDWMASRHPDYLLRLRELVSSRRVEILGGAYHDPLLPLLPRADRRGQIEQYSRRAAQLFGTFPRGMWLPERIWEPAVAADMAHCHIEHTVLDDYHFGAVGLSADQLRGYYLTEADGRLVALFAGDERLRYLIPFADPAETLDYLHGVARAHPGGIVVYADDAEKFGAWPGQLPRMQNEQWLHRFFEALDSARAWLHVTTLGECIDHVAPLGKVYIPEGSYREMQAWAALPAASLTRPVQAAADVPAQPAAPAGTWRNFRVKYPEVNEMYSRMLQVSRRCAEAEAAVDVDSADAVAQLDLVRAALYRAQCGCPYWHGIFGGVYLPQLRQAVYENLIAAERLLDAAQQREPATLTAAIDDFNLDVHKEIRLDGAALSLFIAPAHGGMIYELDVKQAGTNLGATLARRPEPYHPADESRRADAEQATPVPASDTRLIYDSYPRKSLLDHFYDPHVTLDAVASTAAVERGDFLTLPYRARVRRVAHGARVSLSRRGQVGGRAVTVDKHLTVAADHSTIDIRYELSELRPGVPLCFAVEFNFAGLPVGCADRYFVAADGRLLGDFGAPLDLHDAAALRLVDRWRGLDIRMASSALSGWWAFPVTTISRSQQGLEPIVQSIAVLPHWNVVPDADGRWRVDLQLAIDTSAVAITAASQTARAGSAAASAQPAPSALKPGVAYTLDGPHDVLRGHQRPAAPAPFDLSEGY